MLVTEERRWGRAKLLRVGGLLKRLREAHGDSPRQLCELIAMTQGQLSDIERGIKPLTLRRAKQLYLKYGATSELDEIVCQILQEKLEEVGFTHLRVKLDRAEPEPEPEATAVHRVTESDE